MSFPVSRHELALVSAFHALSDFCDLPETVSVHWWPTMGSRAQGLESVYSGTGSHEF